MKKNFVKEYLSIPNLLGYFRLILVPVYLYIYLNAETTHDYYTAAFIMFLSFLSDFIDGKIARRFNMITEFGKILDPVADKITQFVLALSFAFRYPAVRILLAVFVVKELTMGILGLYMMKQNYRMNGAQMHGKICTAILDFTMFILLLFPAVSANLVYSLTTLCIVSMAVSFTLYLRMYFRVWKNKKAEKQLSL